MQQKAKEFKSKLKAAESEKNSNLQEAAEREKVTEQNRQNLKELNELNKNFR